MLHIVSDIAIVFVTTNHMAVARNFSSVMTHELSGYRNIANFTGHIATCTFWKMFEPHVRQCVIAGYAHMIFNLLRLPIYN